MSLLCVVIGTAAACYYASLDLTLSHYDARGHLLVARRVFDNLTPGWIQLGAVWLPLPHLLNMVPVQWDWSYRTGATGVLWSVVPLALGLGALAGYVSRTTGSAVVAVAIPLAVLLNPNVLYLQSTPMTEPLLFGLACLALVLTDRWIDTPTDGCRTAAGLTLAALVLTRYEGWCIAGALLCFAGLARPRRVISLAAFPLAAVIGFFLLSWGSTGRWFVTSGFFEAINPALGRPVLALEQILWETRRLSHATVLVAGALGMIAAVWVAWTARGQGRPAVIRALLPFALLAAVALPFYAFINGHPVRVRYMVPAVVALTVLAAGAMACLPLRLRALAAAAFLAVCVLIRPPLDPQAPMVREAQWDRPHSEARRAVTVALTARWDGSPVLASMGSLGHYMQQMAGDGIRLRDFLHEGNGALWAAAVKTPRRYVRWILIEESAEGGDTLAQRARDSEAFLEGFTRIAEGGGVALYAR